MTHFDRCAPGHALLTTDASKIIKLHFCIACLCASLVCIQMHPVPLDLCAATFVFIYLVGI